MSRNDCISIDDLRIAIAHEWGHYIAFYLLGYGDDNEGFIVEANICGLYGHTTNFNTEISDADNLVILYAGPIAETLYCGHARRITYTDAQEARNIEPKQKVRQMARKRAADLLAPYDQVIKSLVSATFKRDIYCKSIDLTCFYDRVFRDEASNYLKCALSLSGPQLNNSSYERNGID